MFSWINFFYCKDLVSLVCFFFIVESQIKRRKKPPCVIKDAPLSQNEWNQ